MCPRCGSNYRVVSVRRDPWTGRYATGKSSEVRCSCGLHPDSSDIVSKIRAQMRGESRSYNHWNPRPYEYSPESRRYLESRWPKFGCALLWILPVCGFLAGASMATGVVGQSTPAVWIGGSVGAFLSWLLAAGIMMLFEMPWKRAWDRKEQARVEYNMRVRREHEERGERTYSGVTSSKWEQALDEFDHRCAYCSCELTPDNTHRDHFMPFARGGADDISNLVPACGSCNRAKRDKLPDVWLAEALRTRRKVNPKLYAWRDRIAAE